MSSADVRARNRSRGHAVGGGRLAAEGRPGEQTDRAAIKAGRLTPGWVSSIGYDWHLIHNKWINGAYSYDWITHAGRSLMGGARPPLDSEREGYGAEQPLTVG